MSKIEAHGLVWTDEEYGWSARATVGTLPMTVHAVEMHATGLKRDNGYGAETCTAQEWFNYKGSDAPLVEIDGKPHLLIAAQ